VALRDPSNRALDYRIEGHTDAKGSIAYNQVLSQRRAEAARNYLITMGIGEERLSAVGFGKTRPLPNPPRRHPMHLSTVGSSSAGPPRHIELRQVQEFSRACQMAGPALKSSIFRRFWI